MMRSLFAGVSGLKSHQIQMDVIGNNIANINTVGFKSGRVTFEESLTQLLSDASRARSGIGGINPMQVGLGISVGSIDTDFSQGNLETTGNTTDLAIQGNSFFVLSDGEAAYYTRAGNFVVDGSGQLVSSTNGYIVQGLLANSNGEIPSGSTISDIVLPFGQKAPAHATTKIDYSCNLDSDTQALSQIWSSDFGTRAVVTASAVPTSLTIGALNNTLTIEVDDDTGSTVTRTLTLTNDTYASVSDLVAEINAQISNDSYLAGEVEASVVDSGGSDVIRLSTTDGGGTSTELTLSGNACANLNLSTATVTGTGASADLNDMSFVTNDMNAGDIVVISGINPDGSVVSAQYVYAAGDTVQDLIDSINSAFSGATADLGTDGQLNVTNSIAGESSTSVSLTFQDDDGSGSLVVLPAFESIQEGRDAGTHTASITVYDSLGAVHTVALTLTNISTADSPNVWAWEAVVDNGDIIASSGSKGTVRFNPDGSLAIFSVTDGQPLTFDPGSGADTVSINLGAGDQNDFNGITQLSSPTTTVAKDQDGYGMGNLQTISIDETGTITGNFSNGVEQALAQIVLANFNNPSGLVRSGDGLYETSANSGTAVKGTVGGGIQSTISSGSLEMSNVDLAQEFTDMIIAQRGYQANARVITTADTLLDEIVRLRR